MGKITLKTAERKTSVTRQAVKEAVAEVFKDYKNFNSKPGSETKPAKGRKKKPA